MEAADTAVVGKSHQILTPKLCHHSLHIFHEPDLSVLQIGPGSKLAGNRAVHAGVEAAGVGAAHDYDVHSGLGVVGLILAGHPAWGLLGEREAAREVLLQIIISFFNRLRNTGALANVGVEEDPRLVALKTMLLIVCFQPMDAPGRVVVEGDASERHSHLIGEGVSEEASLNRALLSCLPVESHEAEFLLRHNDLRLTLTILPVALKPEVVIVVH